MLPYHRADFLQVLESNAPTYYETHFGKRLESFVDSPSGPILLFFKDGTTAECDLLVGADGIKSSVRKCMYEQLSRTCAPESAAHFLQHIDARWTGQVVYRALVPREALEAAFPGHESLDSPTYVSHGSE